MMENFCEKELFDQIIKVISMLSDHLASNPSPMVESLLKKYKQAKLLLENNQVKNLTKSQFQFQGGVRAYLESSSDYMNPMLGEMDAAEKLLKKVYDALED